MHPQQSQAAASWDEGADDGSGFFDDTPAETLGQLDDGNLNGGGLHGLEGSSREGAASAPANEAAVLSFPSANGHPADPAWRPEASSGSPSISPFTALSSEVPSDWYSNQEVSEHAYLELFNAYSFLCLH